MQSITPRSDEYYMAIALELAKVAESDHQEVPIGAVIVDPGGQILSRAHNKKESTQQATAHAEILAINSANSATNNWRLQDCTLYVTVEPCAMCAGAILQSRIKRLVYGCKEPKFGCVSSLASLLDLPGANHKVQVVEGIMSEECSAVLKSFFRAKRAQKKHP